MVVRIGVAIYGAWVRELVGPSDQTPTSFSRRTFGSTLKSVEVVGWAGDGVSSVDVSKGRLRFGLRSPTRFACHKSEGFPGQFKSMTDTLTIEDTHHFLRNLETAAANSLSTRATRFHEAIRRDLLDICVVCRLQVFHWKVRQAVALVFPFGC